MVEQREIVTETPDGRTRTHTTVVQTESRSRAGTWMLVFVLALLVIAAIWAFTSLGDAEIAKDNAIAGAAGQVGEAAAQVGDAAQDAADTLEQ